MRREAIKPQSYIDWLKSLGCVFYAPLIVDTIDIINNQNATRNGNAGTFNANGYNVSGGTTLSWANWFIKTVKYTQPLTVLLDYRLTTKGSVHRRLVFTTPRIGGSNEHGMIISWENGGGNNATFGFRNASSVYSATTASAMTLNTSYVKNGFIYDGNGVITAVKNGIITSTTRAITSSNFSSIPMTDNNFNLFGVPTYSSDRWSGSCKNAMMFNRALTQDEINAI